MRVVLDTNILISAVLGGRLSSVLDAWRADQFIMLVNHHILREYREVLARPKFGLTTDEVDSIIGYIFHNAQFVTVIRSLQVIIEDSADNRFLEVALVGKADYIVSGDRHLLDLKVFEDIPVLTGRSFLDLLEN